MVVSRNISKKKKKKKRKKLNVPIKLMRSFFRSSDVLRPAIIPQDISLRPNQVKG